MSDEIAATPSPEAAPTTPPKTPEEAKSLIRDALARQEGRAAPQAAQTTPDPVPPHPNEPKPGQPKGPDGKFVKAEPESRVEGEPEAPAPVEAEDTSEQQAEGEDQTETVEVPDTIHGLAEHLGVDPEDLLGHIHIEMKGEDGKPIGMSLAEALRGTLRNDDYTRKTQKLAEDRRSHETAVQQAQQALSTKHQQLDQLLNVLVGEFNEGPSWQVIMSMADPNSTNYNPTEYVTARAKFEARSQKLNAALAANQQEKQAQDQQRQQSLAQFRQEQQQKLQAWFPDANDKAKLTKFEADVRDYMTKDLHPTAKFTSEEVDSWFSTYDARQVLILRDALAFRALSKGKEQTVKTLKALPRVSKPQGLGGTRTNAAQSEVAKSRERLSKPGASKDDAVKYLRSIVRA
jgi:hypothetical protein